MTEVAVLADAHLDCVFVRNKRFLKLSLIVKSQQNRVKLVARPEGAASTQSAMVTSSMMTLSLFLDGLLLLQGTNPIELGPGLVEDETAKSWSKETVLKKKCPVISC